jgi:hypothetical protein
MKIGKPLYCGAGFVAVGLAAAGVFLPLLPTTPFLLIAAACFAKSSDRFYNALLSHRIFRPMIKDYREKGGIAARTKAVSISLLWLTISLSAFLAVSSWPLRGLLFLVATLVTAHILSFKTVE